MRTELFATLYFLTLGSAIITVSLFHESKHYDAIFFIAIYLTLIVGAIHFSLSSKLKVIKYGLACLTGQLFSGIAFEIIFTFNPEMNTKVSRPSETFVWWVLAIMATVTIAFITNKNEGRLHK